MTFDIQGSATWRAMEGRQAAVWGVEDIGGSVSSIASSSSMGESGFLQTHNSATHVLGNAVILKASIIEHQSSFGVPIGVTINCLPCNETTASGEAYCYTVLPESFSNTPIVLYEDSGDNDNGNRWRFVFVSLKKCFHTTLKESD